MRNSEPLRAWGMLEAMQASKLEAPTAVAALSTRP